MSKRDIVPRIARWWLKLLEYDYTVVHRAAKQMAHVDALSRCPVEKAVSPEPVNLNIFRISIDDDDWLQSVQLQDEQVSKIKTILGTSPTNNTDKQIHLDYRIVNNRVYRKINNEFKLFVPKGVRNRVLHKSHDDRGHYSRDRTLKNIKERYWFPRMVQFVNKYIKSCVECAYNKHENQPKGQLHPIEKGNRPFETIHIDHRSLCKVDKRKQLYTSIN